MGLFLAATFCVRCLLSMERLRDLVTCAAASFSRTVGVNARDFGTGLYLAPDPDTSPRSHDLDRERVMLSVNALVQLSDVSDVETPSKV